MRNKNIYISRTTESLYIFMSVHTMPSFRHAIWSKERTPYVQITSVCPTVCGLNCLFDCHQNQYTNYLQNAVEQAWVSWLAQWQSHFTKMYKWFYESIFCVSWMIWVKFSTGDFHVMPSTKCKFCENWRHEISTLFKGVNEFLPVLCTFIVQFGLIWYKRSAHNKNENLWAL